MTAACYTIRISYRLSSCHSSTSIKTQDKKSNKTQDNKNTSQYKVNDPN